MDCGQNYSLGHSSDLFGEPRIVYEKQTWFENGFCRFRYSFSNQLETEGLYNEAFTGLGLTGTVEDTENETVRIRLDIGEDSGGYYYPWRPETGNALYAMPETGTKAVLYFRSHDEREGVAVRCVGASKGDWKPEDKVNQMLAEQYVSLQDDRIEIRKKKDAIAITDSALDFYGN